MSIRTHDAPDLLLTNWCQLQELNLSQTDLHGKAWHLSKHAWPELLALSLPGNELDSQDLQHLLSVPWPKLRRLCLMGNLFDGSSLQQILQASLPSIQELDLRHCTIARDEWPCNLNIDLPVVQLPCLEWLDVGENDLDDLYMAEMQKVCCPLLAHLNAEDSIRFSSAGLHQLVCWPLSSITHLELSCCGVNLAGVKELVEGRWPCLLELDLSYNELDMMCVSCLTACDLWPRLQKLHLSHSQLINRRFRSISLRAGCILPLQLLEGSEAIPRWLTAQWPCITCVDLSIPKGVCAKQMGRIHETLKVY